MEGISSKMGAILSLYNTHFSEGKWRAVKANRKSQKVSLGGNVRKSTNVSSPLSLFFPVIFL